MRSLFAAITLSLLGTCSMDRATRNSMWICQVREALSDGLGVEDIALKLSCAVEDVRREVRILREGQNLQRIFERKQP